MQYYLCSESVN